MSSIALEFDGVWKKFRKGQRYDSLRDLVPAMLRGELLTSRRDELRAREFWALQDVSFQLKRGETLGIIGPNGSGKSTTLKLLSRIMKPTKGHIRVNGKLSALIEVGAGFHPDLTGRENVYLNGSILGMRKEEVDRKFDEIVQFAGLEDFIDTPVKRYSSGMYARLGFSVAAHVDPEILLVDEVLSVGDTMFQQKCIERMRKIATSGSSVVFISHNLQSVHLICPETLYLEYGKSVKLGPTAEVIKAYVSAERTIEDQDNLRASIENVEIGDRNGLPRDMFEPGEAVQVRFKLQCKEPLTECLLGFLVSRSTDGLEVCDYNMPLACMKNGRGPEDLCLSLTFVSNLLRGSYAISLHIYHIRTSTFLCFQKNVASLSIEERISWAGVAHLAPILAEVRF